MRMLRWTCDGTKLDKIRNEGIKSTVKVTKMSNETQERRWQWYGHVMRRDKECVGKRELEMEVQRTRSRGRPRQRWMDGAREDLRERELTGEELWDRAM